MKINFEITVDVRGMSIEDSKKAQDAFFELGYGWKYKGKSHWALNETDHSFYTNRDDSGVTGHLMAWYEARMMLTDMYRPTHTYQELLELARMDALQDLNNDELRTKLTENTDKVNKLLLQNDEIIEVLRSRDLAPIEISQRYILDEPRPLTTEDLMKGGWWMSSASEEDLFSLRGMGLKIGRYFSGYGSLSLSWGVVTGWSRTNYTEEPNEIHRIGADFFWGAPALDD